MAAGGSGGEETQRRGNKADFDSRFGGIEGTVFGELGLTMLHYVAVC